MNIPLGPNANGRHSDALAVLRGSGIRALLVSWMQAASLAVDERSMFQKRESIVENAEVLAGTMTTMATRDTPQFARSCKSNNTLLLAIERGGAYTD